MFLISSLAVLGSSYSRTLNTPTLRLGSFGLLTPRSLIVWAVDRHITVLEIRVFIQLVLVHC